MAAIVPDYKGLEVTQREASPNGVQNKPNQTTGKVRLSMFYFFPTAAVAATKVIALARLPAGARILGVKVMSNAFVATSTADVGIIAADGSGVIDKSATADSATFFTGGGTLAVATAGVYDAANTTLNNSLYELIKECYIALKLNTAGMDGVADILQGYVLYVQD